jgi:hypothetical protein
MQTDTRISGGRFRLKITPSNSSTNDRRPFAFDAFMYCQHLCPFAVTLFDETVPVTALCQRACTISFVFQICDFFFFPSVSADLFQPGSPSLLPPLQEVLV